MIPETEFRTLAVSSTEPVDRTTGGTFVGDGTNLDLDSVDTTDEAQDTPVKVIWWRVTDMKGNTEITNMRVWISSTTGYVGTNTWYMDITDIWTQNKTSVQVKTGTPGTSPTSEPQANLTRTGGGAITGTVHTHTSQYIYITGTIGVNETTGDKIGLQLTVTFDYH
ncbi:hypothetical protein ACFL1R_07380 [Candidatus Latescibacterota bacterium]